MSKDPSILLIDGEHYPPVIARAVDRLKQRGEQPLLALLVGGGEKLVSSEFDVGVPVRRGVEDPERALVDVLRETGAARVVDLSDEPVLSNTSRARMASIALFERAGYEGPDFTFVPPPRPVLARAPSVAIIGSGKRTGKTAVAAAAARLWDSKRRRPVVVAMGRGGPEEPEIIADPKTLDPKTLLEWMREGRHAASDYIEDAMMARVPTVGAWRTGGGFAGAVDHTNFADALEQAHGLDPGLLVLEGSGAAIPPAHSDATVLVVGANTPPEHVCGYFGLYRLLLADLVVLTMVEESIHRDRLDAVASCIRSTPLGEPRVVRTVFRPKPLQEVRGKRIWLVTTAPESSAPTLTRHLEEAFGGRVAGSSHSLSSRRELVEELEALPEVDALVVELKAAAVDVVAAYGEERDVEVIYMDNEPVEAKGEEASLDAELETIAELAEERHQR